MKSNNLTMKRALSNARDHFITISSHKAYVAELCFRVGLIWQGITHDLSKYSPVEFATGIRYFQGNRSPNSAERQDKGFSEAWLHHKGRNRHHFEYWTDITKEIDASMRGKPMPTRYVVEMMCDRIAASKVYEKDAYTDASALKYFENELKLGGLPMHEDTAAFLYALLTIVAQMGEDEALAYVRDNVVKPRYVYCDGGRF